MSTLRRPISFKVLFVRQPRFGAAKIPGAKSALNFTRSCWEAAKATSIWRAIAAAKAGGFE
jgi:hypothetical protein